MEHAGRPQKSASQVCAGAYRADREIAARRTNGRDRDGNDAGDKLAK